MENGLENGERMWRRRIEQVETVKIEDKGVLAVIRVKVRPCAAESLGLICGEHAGIPGWDTGGGRMDVKQHRDQARTNELKAHYLPFCSHPHMHTHIPYAHNTHFNSRHKESGVNAQHNRALLSVSYIPSSLFCL
ncbi:unnamed protein product [Pleuronectes platessa]|uniref:Uncharacterized protein n=1 Tax=Pleuronectes platessa TaxID=8262 RepID=A0A9N7Z0L8_PLEPL|nr:unnamed protein product [Pleuronectes platessa]